MGNYISMHQEKRNGKMRMLVAVDYSNFVYRAYFSSLHSLEVRPWLPFLRALDMLRSCIQHCRKKWPGCSIEFIFCGDSVRKKLDRMKTDENYKADRPPLTNLRFYIFRKLMALVIEDIGCEIVYFDGQEGDDVMASVVHGNCKECTCEKPCEDCKHADPNFMVVIFTCDKDLNALLKYRNVIVYRPPDIWYTACMFEREYGFHPRYFTAYKAMIGDKSDGVKGVEGWGPSRAKCHILKQDWEKVLQQDPKSYAQYLHAYELVKLNYEIEDTPITGMPIRLAKKSDSMNTIFNEYHRDEAVSDILFAEKRLEEVFKNA